MERALYRWVFLEPLLKLLPNFQVTEENFGATEVLELVPNGEDINVNKSNR